MEDAANLKGGVHLGILQRNSNGIGNYRRWCMLQHGGCVLSEFDLSGNYLVSQMRTSQLVYLSYYLVSHR